MVISVPFVSTAYLFSCSLEFVYKLGVALVERNKGVKRSLFELNSTSQVFLDVGTTSFDNSTSNTHGK